MKNSVESKLNPSWSCCPYRVTGQSNRITLLTWMCVMFSWLLLFYFIFFLLFIFLFDLCALPLLLKASFCLDFAAWKLLETLSMRRDAMRCESVCYRFNLIRLFRFVYLSILSEIEKHTYPNHTHSHTGMHTCAALPCCLSSIAHRSYAACLKDNVRRTQMKSQYLPSSWAQCSTWHCKGGQPNPPTGLSTLSMCFHLLHLVPRGVCVMCQCVCTLCVYS